MSTAVGYQEDPWQIRAHASAVGVDVVRLGLRTTAEVYDRVEDDNTAIFRGAR